MRVEKRYAINLTENKYFPYNMSQNDNIKAFFKLKNNI